MDSFRETDTKYHSGIELDEYQGSYSLVNAKRGKDEIIYKEWVYPQRDKKPIEKCIPWKITIGGSAEEAIETLQYFIELLSGDSAPKYVGPDTEDDDLPF